MGAIQQGDTDDEGINLSILSADVPADVDRLTRLGASVVVPVTALSDVTVFTRLKDPRGNLFSIFSRSTSERITGTQEHMQKAAFTPQPGSMAWFEIGTADPGASMDFYASGLGWRFEKDEASGGTPSYSIVGPGAQWPSGGLRGHVGEG